MTTNPAKPQRWPRHQEKRRIKVIELSDDVLALVDEARDKVDRSRHKAEINLDLADVARYVERIRSLMIEAGMGIE